jgi:hypothetical protein
LIAWAIKRRSILIILGKPRDEFLVDVIGARAPVWSESSNFKFQKFLMKALLNGEKFDGLTERRYD